MGINTRLLPIKLHYFFYLGSMAPVLPFLMVLALQLGIPMSVQGTLSALSLIATVLCKPVVSALADKYPRARKAIFVWMMIITVVSYGSVYSFPRIIDAPSFLGRVLGRDEVLQVGQVSFQSIGNMSRENVQEEERCQGDFVSFETGDCFASSAWDCRLVASHTSSSSQNTTASSDTLPETSFRMSSPFNASHDDILYILKLNGSMNFTHNSTTSTVGKELHIYQMSSKMPGCDVINLAEADDITLVCDGGDWSGDLCPNVWRISYFWAFMLSTLIANIAMSTVYSVTDAICVDTVGENGNYGSQRVWGSIGWGLVAPLSGFLVDSWSGSFSKTKIYMPALIILFVLGGLDILTAVFSLHIPLQENRVPVWQGVLSLLKQKRFLIFIFFVVLCGALNGLIIMWLLVLQEDMVVRSGQSMSHMKLLQGITLLVESFSEVPCMYASGPILRRLGAQRVLSIVLSLYVLRYGLLYLVGIFGNPWGTLIVEVLHGPCYGLGYATIAVHAGSLAPPGTSATVQSVVNICYESIGFSIALLLGGVLFESVGGPNTFLIFALVGVVVFLLHFFSWCCTNPEPTTAVPDQGDRNMEVTYNEKDGAKVTVFNSPTEHTYL
ncbi:major facilitator superfamily domain-containing protein 6-like [Oratosquilla oratoria]|uniref:major facilitator superfamily domain-containing protein 6-like n=1 Tax=Oratosquilla oratoria TaxID=337810 RepID=UPI003F7695CF